MAARRSRRGLGVWDGVTGAHTVCTYNKIFALTVCAGLFAFLELCPRVGVEGWRDWLREHLDDALGVDYFQPLNTGPRRST